MKIIVFSDSHGTADNMLKAVAKEDPDMLIHLGDGEPDLRAVADRYPELPIRNVRGNCDIYSSAPSEITFSVEGIRFFITHGNLYSVKDTEPSDLIMAAALENDADVVLHGHRHIPYIEKTLGTIFMDPGTCQRCSHATYGIIEIRNGRIEPDYCAIVHI